MNTEKTTVAAGSDAAPDTAGIIAPPPLLLAGALLAARAAHRSAPLPLPGSGVTRALGAATLATAIGTLAAAQRALMRSHTPIDPYRPTAAIVADGPYRISRNPVYLAFVATAIGAGLVTRSAWPLLLSAPLALALDRGVIQREERYLERKFGDEYRGYKLRVRRWL